MSPPAKNCRVKFRYVGLEKHSKLGGRKKSGITFLTGCTFSVPQWMKGAFLRLLIYHLWMHPRTVSVHGMETWIQWTFITSLRSLGQRCFALSGDKMTDKWCSIVPHMAAHSLKIWRTSTPFAVFFFTGQWRFSTVWIWIVFMSSLPCCCESRGVV